MKKLRWLKARKESRDELEELLKQPFTDEEHRRMVAWLKIEKNRYGRDHKGGYRDWLEANFGPIDDADEGWLMPTTKRTSDE